ncbi:MAG: HEAT repeat domain-containing protein, partial [Anaerolineae bacterium]
EIRDPRAVDGLLAALHDETGWVRYQAAVALGKIRDPRAVPKLERLAREDPDARVAEAAWEAIARIQQRMAPS